MATIKSFDVNINVIPGLLQSEINPKKNHPISMISTGKIKNVRDIRKDIKILEVYLNGAELPLNSVNSANSGDLKNH